MPLINFKAKLFKIESWVLLWLPKVASVKLPSRGQVMVKGTINDVAFQTALEPDGRGSHWFKVDTAMRKAIKAEAGDTVTLAIEPIKEWPEPTIPEDLKAALATADPQVQTLWKEITPVARWDWIRWIQATKNPETRKKRIAVAQSKLKAGTRRPCCFNRTQCTIAEVSYNGMLIEPA